MFFFGNFVFAGETQVSRELLTVKASANVLKSHWYKNFDLSKVYEASSADSGKTITVTLKFTADVDNIGFGEFVPAECVTHHWFKYDGTQTLCEECQDSSNGLGCSCEAGRCVTFDKRVITNSISNVNFK